MSIRCYLIGSIFVLWAHSDIFILFFSGYVYSFACSFIVPSIFPIVQHAKGLGNIQLGFELAETVIIFAIFARSCRYIFGSWSLMIISKIQPELCWGCSFLLTGTADFIILPIQMRSTFIQLRPGRASSIKEV